MSWQTPITDHTELSLFSCDDMNRIAGNINFLQQATDVPDDLILASDNNPSSRTYQHLLMQKPDSSKLSFRFTGGRLEAFTVNPEYEISTIELTSATEERATYTATFTNSETEVFYVQSSLYLVVMTIKADYVENDILTSDQWREVIDGTVALCNKYGIKYTQAPDTRMTADNINNVENLLLLCYEALQLWQKQATTNVYVSSLADRYVAVPGDNYVRGFNY